MTDKLSRIAELNDRCRIGLDRNARILITACCLAALSERTGPAAIILAQAEVLAAVRRYVFRPEDGRQRDRGELLVRDQTIRFKIDYYDLALEWGSEDPADPSVTTRVMTIMLPEDD
ncbi:hypothetical protein AWL63_23290 (plasmid) [Sphingomonas panacis]|uniref:DUF3768 domain-containing protein n=1 Tax=Sphingomonas panacis TaxID=1560345 RepID=A0A1B3ZI66_9SPHN|nr:DUF3768 domain-containing protein [Sphingomonas panacis]AOH87106.1 hypothetical protein AWL63_23290 [Sphingomonas panacis]